MPLPFLLLPKIMHLRKVLIKSIILRSMERNTNNGREIGSWNDGGEMGDINLDVKTGDEENK